MTYSLEQTKALLDAQVSKKGADYVYPAGVDPSGVCVYFDSTGPSCIVGHVLADIGVNPEDVIEGEDLNGEPEEITGLFDEPAFALLYTAQASQDLGTPWGRAVSEAYNYVLAEEEDNR